MPPRKRATLNSVSRLGLREHFLRINANFKLIITWFLHIIARYGLFCFLSAHYYLSSAHYCLLSADFSYLVRIIACFLCLLAYFLRHITNFYSLLLEFLAFLNFFYAYSNTGFRVTHNTVLS